MGSQDELAAAAGKLGALAREHAAETERRRALAPAVLAGARASGLFRAGLPAALGGTEPSAAAILRAAEKVAEGDASAGWCVSIAATSSLLGAYLPEAGGREVFGDPGSAAGGVWAPRGKAVPVEGGVTVSGRWSFCSGVPHAEWVFLGCLRRDPDGPVVAAIPTAELTVHDTWHTSGLRGTGSHDTSADGVFVPAHRLMSVVDGPPADSGALHRFPLFGFFAASIAAAALGNARGAITDLAELAGVKNPSGSRRTLAGRSATQIAVAEAEASLRAAREFFYRAIDDAWQAAEASIVTGEELRLALRLASTHAVRTSADVARVMHDLGGGTAIYESSPLQRRFRDAHTATAHFQVNPATYELAGRLLLGVPVDTSQL
ncbi:acyl-CoA dehydrogenase family protein [Amycolatopsis sp. PS_44_ISF1]|uniref:acyl-CoA dehydrogenase family protein n=1 Tax=Amycolatopsis sp. PS_44_ISF1 TaxID=2974917 RepID=UPI0028DF3BF6|nr:acyl-CoA dehydrogenase family protein [Amycolatopsis sp. PS_44_ISF1]MDT8913788.1 acyl-CoA dehydrogenase family protein [Amycolatopsis sp. PS_44_ISF1]